VSAVQLAIFLAGEKENDMRATRTELACALITSLGLSGFGCAGQIGNPSPPSDGEQVLTLTSSTPTQVTGTFVDQRGTLVRFETVRTGDDLYLDVAGADGVSLVHLETTATSYEFSYLGGQLRLHATKSFVDQARAQAAQNPANVSTDGFIFDGDMSVLDAMLKRPEATALPFLSQALGMRGLSGSAYPATLALHKIAQQSAGALGVQLTKVQTLTTSSSGSCDTYPDTANDCFGMCGPGCSCWDWVCGDCCYHYGCALHDEWCREGEWYLCYDITAVVTLFGC
jgi:hypothetical protein